MRKRKTMTETEREGEGREGERTAEEGRVRGESGEGKGSLTSSVSNVIDLVYVTCTFSHQSLDSEESNTRSRVHPGSRNGIKCLSERRKVGMLSG